MPPICMAILNTPPICIAALLAPLRYKEREILSVLLPFVSQYVSHLYCDLSVLKRSVPKKGAFAFGLRLRSGRSVLKRVF